MTEPNAVAAEMLEASASGYAAAAATILLREDDSFEARYGRSAMASWKAHFVQRLLELAAAVRLGEPKLFTARIMWQHKAFTARQSNPGDLQHALQCLQRTLAKELPKSVNRLVNDYLEQGLAALGTRQPLDPTELDPKDASGALALRYIAACLEGNSRQAIDLIMDAAAGGLPMETIYLHVLFPAQKEIGRMWHAAEATVAEERLVTETTRRVMALLSREYSPNADTGKTVLTAAVPGNAHDIGIRGVTDLFETAGWRAISLGADAPIEDIANAVRFLDADLVVLATTLATQLKQLQAAIEAVRSTSTENVKILVGGQALTDAPDLWKQIGADGYAAKAGDAVRIGSELVGLS